MGYFLYPQMVGKGAVWGPGAHEDSISSWFTFPYMCFPTFTLKCQFAIFSFLFKICDLEEFYETHPVVCSAIQQRISIIRVFKTKTFPSKRRTQFLGIRYWIILALWLIAKSWVLLLEESALFKVVGSGLAWIGRGKRNNLFLWISMPV